ncbi:Rrf2 family transcriptional regulator [Paucibacter sp. DJ1R-11]|uniref:RrF2 family transcriptional regulator n=1 Tax=Paucibacter sp. DJ1R-11 TaxID=2893556 RepID=UPI0021E3CE10|nr:Rrf2 family transcriptional regulator [Paucibacter sp. DJ1R-11]MCV2361906.1 Rrf2 family transcriptional regulator [Paucibacter sp. DJ1R-11]
MQITQHTDYALRVLIYLASNEERLATVQEIAERFDISRSHLTKVVNGLIRSGFVEGLRGKGGGLRLARPPAEIGVGNVVRQMEGEPVLVECFGEESLCVLSSNCRLKGALKSALKAFFAELDAVTLADLVGKPQWRLMHAPTRPAPRTV